MRVLVTGGAGFIGSHLVDALLENEHSVVVIDDLSTGKKENLNPDAEFHELDIRSPELSAVFQREKPEVAFHFAAQIDVRKSVEEPLFDANTNILGTLNLLECCRKAGVNKVVFASSGGVIYGDTDRPACEGDSPRPLSPYGVAKLACEGYLRCYSAWHSLRYVALRYANVYGPRQDPLGEAGVVAIFSRKLLDGEQPILYGFGKLIRDYLYVDDAVRAALLAADKGQDEVLNAGTGIGTSVNQLFAIVKEITGFDGDPAYEPKRAGELERNLLNPGRAKEVLGWTPEVSLKDGLRRAVEWFKG